MVFCTRPFDGQAIRELITEDLLSKMGAKMLPMLDRITAEFVKIRKRCYPLDLFLLDFIQEIKVAKKASGTKPLVEPE
jgi:hypothetical protein